MAKVIVERPRSGGGARKGATKRLADDVRSERETKHEGMRPRRVYDRKELNENLKPLYRWLDAQVGRPWSKVYSELRAKLDLRSATQLHIMQHATGFGRPGSGYVETSPRVKEDGTLDFGWRLYVDPKTGILRSAGQTRRWRAPKTVDPTIVRASPTKLYKLGGKSNAWYELTMASLPSKPRYNTTLREWWVDSVADAWLGRTLGAPVHPPRAGRLPPSVYDNEDCRREYKDGKSYCKSFRQLSSKEIRKLGLREQQAA
jgi:hypothetical protein